MWIPFGHESIGAFSENFYSYITDVDHKVILLNSYQTVKYKDFSTLKKIKNNSIDPYVIAELLSSGNIKLVILTMKIITIKKF